MIGYVYKWVHEDKPDEVLYVGSTLTLINRFENHMYQFQNNNAVQGPLQRYVYENKLHDGMHMVILETIKDWTKPLIMYERQWQDVLDPRFGRKATCTDEDKRKYRERKYVKEYHKAYAAANWDRIMTHKKKWRDNNPDKRLEINRRYYKMNRGKINERNRKSLAVRINCECGCVVSRRNMSRHRKSTVHKLFVGTNS